MTKKIVIKIKFFGILKETFNDNLIVKLEKEISINDLKKYIITNISTNDLTYIKNILIKSKFSNNKYILNDNSLLKNNDIINILPPFSGG